MKEVKIGNLIISRKGTFRIVFLLFSIGMVIGGIVIAPNDGGNWLIASFIIVMVTAILYSGIRREIRVTK